ncbi:MAG: polysaccharide deacetylase family protein [Pseudomonadota bacterium]
MLRAVFLALAVFALAACASIEPSSRTKRIALTFDDTPRMAGAFMTPDERAVRLRKALRDAQVKQAAFFVNPAQLTHRPGGLEHIRGYVADGHVLANHTAQHSSLTNSSLDEYLADIDAAAEWLAPWEANRPWFRFPYLNEGRGDVEKRDAVRQALAERGLTNGYVTVDASDWFYEQATIDAARTGQDMDMDALRDLYVESHVESAEFFDSLARETLGRSPAHVMLLHETDLAALYIGDLVEALRAAGWTIITADEAYEDPFGKLAATYDTPSAQGTLTEQVAWERGIPAPRWYARNNTKLAKAEFDRRVLGIEADGESE